MLLIHPLSLVRALSLSLELSTKGLSHHHWRTAAIAQRIAAQIKLPQQERYNLIYAALLHDIGAASHWSEREILKTYYIQADAYAHAETGYQLLKGCPWFNLLARTIRHHHDCWDGSSPSGLKGQEIPLVSRIIHLADRLEIQLRDDVFVLEQVDTIVSRLKELSGIFFDPELVAAVEDIATEESFWLDLASPAYYQQFFDSLGNVNKTCLEIDDILGIADMFAGVIDRTSRFTAVHSKCVGSVAAILAEIIGFSGLEVQKMHIAGLLHDLGKLAVPNEILEKPSKLTRTEFNIIKQHTYYTYRVLERIDGFGDITEWAAYHHETMDGTGYPFHISAEQLSLGSRIMAVADVFTALIEERPYRQQLDMKTVQKIMSNMVQIGKLDKARVDDLFTNIFHVQSYLAQKELLR